MLYVYMCIYAHKNLNSVITKVITKEDKFPLNFKLIIISYMSIASTKFYCDFKYIYLKIRLKVYPQVPSKKKKKRKPPVSVEII